jgi:hypothetical protein
MPGMGELIEGAMQQAAQPGRQSMSLLKQKLFAHDSQALEANFRLFSRMMVMACETRL